MYKYNDGGRSESGFKGKSGDCGARSIAIATNLSYKQAINLLKEFAAKGRLGSKAISKGVYKEDMDAALTSIGWVWCAAPKFDGRKAKYTDIDGIAILRMAKHYSAVVDGVLHDTFDCTNKMVYGYWKRVEDE